MYMDLKQNLSQSKVLKPLATLLSGNVLAQGITMLSYLLLTRIFTPDDFGVFNIFYSYIEVLIILSTWKYELVPVIAQDNREVAAVKRFTLRLNAIVSFVLLGIITLLYFLGALPSKIQSIGLISLLIPFMVFFCGTTRVYAALFNRYENFKQIALSDITISLTGAVAKILMGISTLLHPVGLPWGTVLGQAAGNLNYVVNLRKLNLPSDISRDEMWAMVRKYKNFPLFTAPKDFIDALSANLPFIWLPLAMCVGDAELGLLGLALTFTFRPANVYNNASERVLYVRVSEGLREHRKIGRQLLKFVLWTNVIVVPLAAIGFVWGEPIFSFVFGSEWAGSGPYLRALIPWILLMTTTNSLYCVPYAFGRQRGELFFCIALLVLRIAGLYMGVCQGCFIAAIIYYAAASGLISLSRLIWYAAIVRRHDASC